MTATPEQTLGEVVRRDGRYPLEAFAFLHEGLGRAVRTVHGEEPGPEGSRHVSGQQLCQALRDEAIERWGMMAAVVLERWNIRETLDFGHMVYLLIDNGLMHKTAEDSLEDFRDVFDFATAFSPARTFRSTP